MVHRKGDPQQYAQLTEEGVRAANNAWKKLAVIYGCGWAPSESREGFPPFPLDHRLSVMRGITHYLKENRGLYSYGEIMRLLNVPSK